MIIKNAKFYLGGHIVEKDIKMEKGKISAFGHFSGEGIDAKGLFALPGLIDPHVHLRDPGLTHKEDFASGTRAALCGGFTTVLDMPNTKPSTTTLSALKEKRKIASQKAVCDYGIHFGATKENFAEVKKAKPPTLKLYMGKSTGEVLVDDIASIWKHFDGFPHEKPLLLHAEDEETLNSLEKLGIKGRAAIAEKIAVEKARLIAAQVNRLVYFAHLSTAESIHMAKLWEKSLVEASPHHLFLSSDKDGKRLKEFYRVNPPLRSEAERRRLWGSLYDIDTVGSDHAPHTSEEKKKGSAGFPGLETSLPLFLDAQSRGLLNLQWIIFRMAENPARIFGLKSKGRIGVGYDADITLVDLKKEWKVSADAFQSKCGWSPYEGMKLKGKVKKVLFRGVLAVEDGAVLADTKGREVLS
jgi:dihydroorotase (multifunctional complex type)